VALHPSPIGKRFDPAPALIVYVGGPRDGRVDIPESPGGVPTILVEALGYYVREEQVADGRWRLTWRGFV
jgi:hypothetical protein